MITASKFLFLSIFLAMFVYLVVSLPWAQIQLYFHHYFRPTESILFHLYNDKIGLGWCFPNTYLSTHLRYRKFFRPHMYSVQMRVDAFRSDDMAVEAVNRDRLRELHNR